MLASANEGNTVMPLQRQQILLAALSLAGGKPLTPVQLQKALFLADDKIGDAFDPSSKYHFQPYDYGPFDKTVYTDAQLLTAGGLAEIGKDAKGGWNTYAPTADGVRQGQEYLSQLQPEQREMLQRILSLVTRLSFTELVSAIYKAYPPMRVNSVFRD
jgi:hypothetical protein